MTTPNSAAQPQGATNNGNLFIPNKNGMQTYDKTKYGTDMRAIERWCNSLISGQDDVEIVLFQHSYTTTGCGPGLWQVFSNVLGSMAAAGNTFFVTFTAPTTGNVKIRLEAYMELTAIDNTGKSGIVLTCVDQATGLVQQSPLELVLGYEPSSSRADIIGHRVLYEGVVTTLTPGTVYNWEIGGYFLPNTNSVRVGLSDGSSTAQPYGPILVTVYAA
jgi:hypothetical protein